MKTERGLVPILIVLILAALIGGYLIYQKQTRSTPPSITTQTTPSIATTATWETTTFSVNNFSIRYPMTWTIVPKGTSNESISYHIESLKRWVDSENKRKNKDHNCINCFKIYWQQETTINNKPTIIQEVSYLDLYTPDPYNTNERYLEADTFDNNTKVVEIWGLLKETKHDLNKSFPKEKINEFSQILSTIQFINPPFDWYRQLPKILLSILYILTLSLIFMQKKLSPGAKILLIFPVTIVYLFLIISFSILA